MVICTPIQIQTFTPNLINLKGVFKVHLSDYCDKTIILPGMPFKLIRVPETCNVTDQSGIITDNRYSDGYWYTDENGVYDFTLPDPGYQISIKSLHFNFILPVITPGADTNLTISSVEIVDPISPNNNPPNTNSPVVHILKNPLQHTPLYKDPEAIAMCVSLTPDRFINNNSPLNTRKYFQELINWVGYYGNYNRGNSGGRLDGNLEHTRGSVIDFQNLVLNTFQSYPGEYQNYLRTDGQPDGLTILALASAYQNEYRRRRQGEPNKVLVKILIKSPPHVIVNPNAVTIVDIFNPTADIELVNKPLREDTAWHFHQFIEEVECKGGIIDVGFLRSFSPGEILGRQDRPPPAARSLISVHYCGLAGDLATNLGMDHPEIDLYVVEREPNTPSAHPRWIVWCRCNDSSQNRALNGWRHQVNNTGGVSVQVNGNFINITEIASTHGINHISGHDDWHHIKNSTEWHHFQYQGNPPNIFTEWHEEMNQIGYVNTYIIDNYLQPTHDRATAELTNLNAIPINNRNNIQTERIPYLVKLIAKFAPGIPALLDKNPF